MNTGAPWPDLDEAERRVLRMQTKLHQWAMADPDRRFDDLFNLVYDPAFLVVAWNRVRGNKGARTAGVDGVAPRSIVFGVEVLLVGLRDDLKAGRFVPQPVREKTIPKASGKVRRLGIPTAADRVVQASLKLVLEPIFEADFKPCSYGFRPKRRAQDAIAEIHYLGSPTRNYEWVFEADIKACFDEIFAFGASGPGAGSNRRQAGLGFGEGVPQSRHPHARMASRGTTTPALPKVGSSHRCWPTSPCRCWTSTSHASGKRSARHRRAPDVDAPGFQPCESSATRMISWS